MNSYRLMTFAAATLMLASPSICFADNGAEPDAGGDAKPAKVAKPARADAPTGAETETATDGDDTLVGGEGNDTIIGDGAADETEVPGVPGIARMKHPAGATSASHGGHDYKVDKDGVFTVPQAAVDDLTSHGFVLVG